MGNAEYMGKVSQYYNIGYTLRNMIGRKDGDFVTLKDVPAGDFIAAYADFLKKSNKIELPSWVDLVKTGHYHELAPYSDDWFYTRAAAIMRKLYVKPTVGVGRLANKFGGKERNGSARKHHAKDSKAVIRACMKALEKAKLLIRYNDPKRNDFAEDTRPDSDVKLNRRVVSDEGKKTINDVAKDVYDRITEL